jgi:hypothetical protein
MTTLDIKYPRMTTPTTGPAKGIKYPYAPPDPMRMLASIDSRLTAIEQNLLAVLDMVNGIRNRQLDYADPQPCRPDGLTSGERFVQLHGLDDEAHRREARRRSEEQAKAIREYGEMLARATREVSR